jgi:multisubunit Na+/H+ antiporter MnhF subunit
VILEDLMVTAPTNQENLMILSMSGVVLLGIIVFLFFRKDGLKASHAMVCALFGFYLAGTAIAPSITAGGASLAGLLGGIKF